MVTGDRYLAQSTITAATIAAPIEIETAQPHGCATGDRVRIDGVQGVFAANNTDARPTWAVTVISPTRLSLNLSDGTASTAYVSGTGRMRGPQVNGSVSIFQVVNANPVVVTAPGHGFAGGDPVTITGVRGTTSANVAGAPIRLLDADSFQLTGVGGHAAFINGPRLQGLSVGRNLPHGIERNHVALVPNAAGPATTIFVSMGTQLFVSVNGGITFVGAHTFADPITALHAPADHRLWVGTAGRTANPVHGGRVFFSTDHGNTFLGTAQHFVSDIGAQGGISAIIEDPAVPARVAVVASGYSQTATERRTRHCFITTTGGITVGGAAAWHKAGGTFNAPAGNLPDIPLMSAGWDTSEQQSSLLVASDAGVLRLGPGQVWQRVGPNLPNVSCQSLAIDTSVRPPVIRVGTYGRSAWELITPPGPSLYVEADLGFGEQQVGTTTKRRLVLHSVGAGTVTVSAIDGASGDISIAPVPPAPGSPVVLGTGDRRAFDVLFAPTGTGDRGAFLTVSSDDPDQPVGEIKATGFGVAAGRPRLGARAFVEFGTVQSGLPAQVGLEIRNAGNATLTVDTVQLDPAGSNRFALPGLPVLPLVIAPGDATVVQVQFNPIANGPARGSVILRDTASGEGQVVNLSGQGTTTAAGMVATLLNVLGVSDPPDVLV